MSGHHSKSKGPSQRQLRAGELIRHALVEILQRENLREPALQGVSVTITEVRVTPDLKQASVYATPFGGERQAEIIDALNRTAPHLRGVLGQKVALKYSPVLKFRADESFDEARRIDALLARPDVARDLRDD